MDGELGADRAVAVQPSSVGGLVASKTATANEEN
jgi:hypothetical protein